MKAHSVGHSSRMLDPSSHSPLHFLLVFFPVQGPSCWRSMKRTTKRASTPVASASLLTLCCCSLPCFLLCCRVWEDDGCGIVGSEAELRTLASADSKRRRLTQRADWTRSLSLSLLCVLQSSVRACSEPVGLRRQLLPRSDRVRIQLRPPSSGAARQGGHLQVVRKRAVSKLPGICVVWHAAAVSGTSRAMHTRSFSLSLLLACTAS